MTKSIEERRQALGISIRELSRATGLGYGTCWAYSRRTDDTEAGFIFQKYIRVLDYLSKKEKEKEEKERQEKKNHAES